MEGEQTHTPYGVVFEPSASRRGIEIPVVDDAHSFHPLSGLYHPKSGWSPSASERPCPRPARSAMLEGIFGNASAEKVLLYLEIHEEGYPTAIVRSFEGMSLNMAQRQLERFERAGALISAQKGKTRV